jgi:hypothetical protein
LLPVVFGALVLKLSVWCGAESYVSGLRAVAIPVMPWCPLYEGRSESNASYFIMLVTTSEANVDMAVEVEPSRQYSVKFCCLATDDSRGAV